MNSQRDMELKSMSNRGHTINSGKWVNDEEFRKLMSQKVSISKIARNWDDRAYAVNSGTTSNGNNWKS